MKITKTINCLMRLALILATLIVASYCHSAQTACAGEYLGKTPLSELNLTDQDFRKTFFDAVRPSFGKLSTDQVAAIEFVLDSLAERKDIRADELAYMLATMVVETNKTMRPIYEMGRKSYFNKYDPSFNPKKAAQLGNIYPGDGYRYRGRGFVQVTGRSNYYKFSILLGIDLVASPDYALDRKISLSIMVYGMQHGTFTGKSLSMYYDSEGIDFIEARRVVNGKDRAEEIAELAEDFLYALLII